MGAISFIIITDYYYYSQNSAAPYKMTEMIPSTSAHLIDRSKDNTFELV